MTYFLFFFNVIRPLKEEAQLSTLAINKLKFIHLGNTGTNEVSGTSQFSLLSLPRAIYGAGQATLRKKGKFLSTTHILSRRDLGDSLK